MGVGQVTDQERYFFETFGFGIWRGWFRNEIDEISQAFDEVFADEANERLTMHHPGYRNQPRTAMIQFCPRHPTLAPLLTDPRPRAIAEALLGPNAECDQTGANIFDCESEWHPDSPTQFPEHRHLKLQLYLEPLCGETGAPRVVPGSHNRSNDFDQRLRGALGFEDVNPTNFGVPSEQVPSWPIMTEPGDVMVWDFRTFHASFNGTIPRRALGMNWHAPRGEAAPVAAVVPGHYAADL